MTVTVRLPGLTMNGLPDSNSDTFRVYDIPGLDGPNLDSELTDRPDIGETWNFSRSKERKIQIKGNAWGPYTNEAAIWRVRQKIETAVVNMISATTPVYIDFPSPGNSILLNCRYVDKLTFDTPNATVQPFTIPLTAADPRKYSQSPLTQPVNNTTVTINNAGNVEAAAYFTLQNPTSSAWIQNNTLGSWSQLVLDASQTNGVIPAGTYIDTYLRQITVPGYGLYDIINLPRTWWGIQPGNNSITASGNWTVSWSHAWN